MISDGLLENESFGGEDNNNAVRAGGLMLVGTLFSVLASLNLSPDNSAPALAKGIFAKRNEFTRRGWHFLWNLAIASEVLALVLLLVAVLT